MKIEQALELLKRYNQGMSGKVSAALTTAIEVMESRKDEITKAWIDGHNRLIPFKQDEVIELAMHYYKSLTRPQSHQNTSLPQYYAVKVELDHPKVEEFWRRINAMYHTNLSIRLKYYGYRDGRYFNCWHVPPRNIPILTIDQWLDAVEPKQDAPPQVTPNQGKKLTYRRFLDIVEYPVGDAWKLLLPYLADEPEVQTITPTKPDPSRLEVADKREQFWKDAWLAVAGTMNCVETNSATKWANAALAAYDELIKQSRP